MKILIVSDTHRKDANLKTVLTKVGPIDHFIHLGDAEGSEDYIKQLVDCPVTMVSGNNDFFSDLEREEEIMLGKYKAFVTHGHYYYVSLDTSAIKEEARERGMNIVMFGHTHKPLLEIGEGMVTLNPGSLSYPRQEGRRPSYLIMEIDSRGEAHYTINYLN